MSPGTLKLPSTLGDMSPPTLAPKMLLRAATVEERRAVVARARNFIVVVVYVFVA